MAFRARGEGVRNWFVVREYVTITAFEEIPEMPDRQIDS
jgi:hypothetical protein